MKRAAILLMLVAICLVFGSCRGGGEEKPKQAPVPVRTAKVFQKDFPEVLRAVGEVEPVAAAAIVPQVSGVLKEVRFSEGQNVTVGDVLFLVDPAPYEAELAQAQGQLEKDRAQLESARAQLKRMEMLIQKDYVSREQFDETKAAAEALAATVRADDAAVKNARIRLEYSSARSPISGRTGALLVKPGNVVTANDPRSTIVKINQLKPVYVRFSIPETFVDSIREGQKKEALKVSALRTGSERAAAQGSLSFLDNAVDRSTGTMLLKATFENADEALWPGEFLDVSLELGVRKGAVIAPLAAIQTGQQGEYVFVINAENQSELRVIQTAYRSDTEAIISKGLQAGDEVVIEGQIRLFPGAPIVRKDSQA